MNSNKVNEVEGLSLRGHLKVEVWRGDKHFVHHDEQNTITQALLNALATDLVTGATNSIGASGSDYHSDNNQLLFANTGEDGMLIKFSANELYGFTMSNLASGDTITCVGTFTGKAGTIALATDLEIGITLDLIENRGYGLVWANPTSWTSLTITAADTLVVTWKIEFKDDA